eukprot:TRINITY_DN3438_c0_g2_i5.p3 TRINITY_DN3438_c0_g2~~TRINITY_DN3438_c0_g2_i5.p3  ORF type:complete len:136 (-),score=2.46 TRINITY_DN3438_c0_g2_i5:23-430(-)
MLLFFNRKNLVSKLTDKSQRSAFISYLGSKITVSKINPTKIHNKIHSTICSEAQRKREEDFLKKHPYQTFLQRRLVIHERTVSLLALAGHEGIEMSVRVLAPENNSGTTNKPIGTELTLRESQQGNKHEASGKSR